MGAHTTRSRGGLRGFTHTSQACSKHAIDPSTGASRPEDAVKRSCARACSIRPGVCSRRCSTARRQPERIGDACDEAGAGPGPGPGSDDKCIVPTIAKGSSKATVPHEAHRVGRRREGGRGVQQGQAKGLVPSHSGGSCRRFAVRQLPLRAREVAGFPVRVALEIVLVFGLGFPEGAGLADLGHDLAGPKT